MKKLRLEIEQLEVESFATAAGREGEPGTVRGLMAAETKSPYVACPVPEDSHAVNCNSDDCAVPRYTEDPNDPACGVG